MPVISPPYFQLTTGGMHTGSLPSAPQSPGVSEADNTHSASPGPGPRTVQRPLCPRYAASISDTESDISDDLLRDSISSNASISSASSVNGDDEQELTHGLIDLSLSHDGIPSLEGKKYDTKKGLDDILPPISASPTKTTPDTTPQASPDTDRSSKLLEMLLNKEQYLSDVAKAAPNETLACFPVGRGRNFMIPPVNIDIPSWQAGLRVHGHDHGRQTGSSHGSSGNNGARAPPIYPPHVKPPHEWGTRNQQQGNGNEDGFEESGWGRENRGSRTKKRIACPAAKGDPFHNRACLGVSFPNLAKTRQHMSCAAHFAVEKTPLLPDEIRDPNGWDEIMAYVYPDKDIPSSDEDFHATMDLIQRKGMGPGKPDFRSTLIRMVKRIMDDRDYGMEVLSELIAIDPSQDDYVMVPPFYSPPSDISSYQTGLDTSDSSTFSQQPGLHFNSPINSEPSKGVFTPVSIGSANTPMLSSYGAGITSTGTFGHRQFSNFASQPTLMDTNQGSPTIPDLHNQADNPIQMNPAGGPSPDRQPQIYVRLPNISYQFTFTGDLTMFENWVQPVIPNFSFEHYFIRVPVVGGSFSVVSIQNLCDVYATFRTDFPGQDMLLELIPKPHF